MIILNTTFILERTLHDEVISWLNEVYLRAALQTGFFEHPRLAQVLTNEDPGQISIACELQCDSLSEAVRWHDETAVMLRSDMSRRWNERVLCFTTYLKIINS